MRILFVCHGNICRSPMAEFVMRDLLKRHRLSNRVEVASAAKALTQKHRHRANAKSREEMRFFMLFSPFL